MTKPEAILLLGPTGSGKTPMGDCLAQRGLYGRRCVHFDFGARLRQVEQHGCRGLTSADITTVRCVLSGGALLEDNTFHIAATILKAFLQEQEVGARDIVVLNGLPRHSGQARDVGRMLNVSLVVVLECTAAVTHERIARNSGGDRTERTDDSLAEIARKLEIYAARTRPLIEYYLSEGVDCRHFPVGVETTPDQGLESLDHPEDTTAAMESSHCFPRRG